MIMRKLPIFTIFLSMLISGCSLEGTPGVNQPPVLEIEPVDPIIQGATVLLDASSSYDPDNDPLSYSWTLEDEELSTEAAFHRQFTEPGIYDIQLTIFDGNDKVFGAAKVLCVEEEEGEVIKIDDLSSYYLAYEHLNSDYLGDFDGGSLLKGSIPRMVEALDDEYAVYYTASEYEAFMDDMEGNLVGIGVYLTLNKEEGYPMVLGTISGSPAEEEGLLLGDLIIKVDEEELADKDFMEAINLIRGEAGTSVTLRIRRNTDQESSELDFVITRKEIQTPSISEAKIVEDTIGYVRIATFTQSDMISELKEALEELKDDGADRFILDLRNNGGGLVGNALNMAKLFLDETQIITIVQSKKLNIYYYQNQKFPEYEEDIVILQNKYSASATEMFAGAMKSNDRSYIIGETSYGKGSMQGIYSLPNGAALKFTIAKYLGPDGSKVDQVGITPDQEVDSSKLYTIGTKEDKAYQEAITHLKSS